MKYEALLSTKDALLHAYAKLEACRSHSKIVMEHSPTGALFVLPPSDFDDVIEKTLDAYHRVDHELFEIEYEREHTIDDNSAVLFGNIEDDPF